MPLMARYSEPYNATGGLAAEGVVNQLGRPDIEPLEVLVREAVQNCWDAKTYRLSGITVEIGRRELNRDAASTSVATSCSSILRRPSARRRARNRRLEIMYFADFGTDGPWRPDSGRRGRPRPRLRRLRSEHRPTS